MDCKEFREVVDLYVDLELAPAAIAAAQVHLKKCNACRRVEVELLRLRQKLKAAVAQHQPPKALVDHVQALTGSRLRRLIGRMDSVLPAHAWFQTKIILPAPVFVSLLLAIITLGIWSISQRAVKVPSTMPSQPTRPASSQLADLQDKSSDTDFSRFDHGQRASIYRARR